MHPLALSILNPQVQAVAVFLVGYVYICAAKKHRAVALWIGVLVLLLLGVYAPDGSPGGPPPVSPGIDTTTPAAATTLPALERVPPPPAPPASGPAAHVVHLLAHINWNVLMILAGAMIVADLFIESRVPVLLADLIVRHLKTVGGAALGVCFLSSLLSAFIDNVTTVLIVAPVALVLAKRLDVSPVPFIIGLAISSNLQGTATLIGDPPSLILANGLRLNFLDFFFYQGKPGIFWAVQLGAIGSMIVLWLLFFRRYNAPVGEFPEERPTSWVPTAVLVAMVLALSIVSQVSRHIPGGDQFANGAVCMLAALIGLAWRSRQDGVRRTLHEALRMDFETVGLLAAIFALTFALDKTGFIERTAGWIGGLVGENRFLTFTVVVWMSVLFSAVIDNIPYTAVMLPTVLRIATRMQGTEPGAITATHILFAFGLLVGACLGGNISPVGASANIVGVGLLRKHGHAVGFWQFVRMGLPFTIAATLPAYAFIWLLWS
jgi:Na+/H+ antiporter NhaD/arsenite permease-like protein